MLFGTPVSIAGGLPNAPLNAVNICLEGFKNLFANKKLAGVTFIAETEHDKIVEDLRLLKSLR